MLNLLCNDAVNREAACFKLMPGSGTHPGQSLLSQGGGAVALKGTGLGLHINRKTVSSLKKNRFDGRRTTLTIKSAAPAP